MRKAFYLFKLAGYCLLLFTFHFSLLPSVKAHRFHTSLTVMEYNSEQKSVEITIQLFTQDLVQVLETKHNKRIDLEKTEADNHIFEYLKENFSLDNSVEKPAKLNWVGKELEVDKIYIYLEIPFEGNLEGKRMQNTIFFETFNEQTNIVICKFAQKKADLLFKVGDKIKEIQVGNHEE